MFGLAAQLGKLLVVPADLPAPAEGIFPIAPRLEQIEGGFLSEIVSCLMFRLQTGELLGMRAVLNPSRLGRIEDQRRPFEVIEDKQQDADGQDGKLHGNLHKGI